MDKFMIDPKEEPKIINKLRELETPNYVLNPSETPENLSIIPTVEPSNSSPMFSFNSMVMWFFILLIFIIFIIYYRAKYTANESNYIIKDNATSFKLSLDEFKEDVKDFLRRWIEWGRSWNENISEKSKQFFFRQHVEDNTFKTKKTVGKKAKKENDNEDTTTITRKTQMNKT